MKKLVTLLLLLFLLVQVSAQTETTVYWHSPLAPPATVQIGMVVSGDPDVVTFKDNMYLETLRTINPGLVQIQAILNPKSSKSWTNPEKQTWQTDTITSLLKAVRSAYSKDIIITIPECPSWMDNNQDGVLDPEYVGPYAVWCAELVKIVNIDNDFNVRYWSPLSNSIITELDANISLATVFNTCTQAMRIMDSSILIGGCAFSEIASIPRVFINQTRGNLDFISLQQNNQGHHTLPSLSIQQDVTSGNASLAALQTKLDSLNLGELPIWITDFHDSSGYESGPAFLTTLGNMDVVFHAMMFKHYVEQGQVNVYNMQMVSRNHSHTDEYHIDMDPMTMLHYLSNKFLSGTPVRTATQRLGEINLLAVDAGSKKNILLINLSDQYQMVDVRFEGWQQNNSSNLCYTLANDDIRIDRQLYASGLENIEMAPLSVQLFSFNNFSSVFEKTTTEQEPVNYQLSQPYPNPFNSTSIIQFSVDDQQSVTISLYNASGQLIQELFNGFVNANLTYTLQIDGTDLASGQYRVVLLGENFTAFRSLVYVK